MNLKAERDLVRRAQEGDNGAFSELVRSHQQFAYNVALRAVNNNQDAEDIVQEAFVRVWKSLSRFRLDARFRTWLYRIVMNLCYNQLPRLKKAPEMLDEDREGQWNKDNGQTGDPAGSLEHKEALELVQRQIQKLPGQYQIMLLLLIQENCTYAEISEIMDLPLGTVKTGLFRARKRLKDAVTQAQEEKVSL
ncbi:MAG: RNA polymerase sigma factor [Anaerolineales bacterium]